MICRRVRRAVYRLDVVNLTRACVLHTISPRAEAEPFRLGVKFPYVAVGYSDGVISIIDMQTGGVKNDH
jgi:hypothetical protein